MGTRIAQIARNPIIDFRNPIIAIIGFESQLLQSEQSESPVSGPKKSIIAIRAIRAIRVAPFRAPESQKLTFESQFLQFLPRDGPRKSDIGLRGGGVGVLFFLLRNVSQNPKKVNNFRRSRRGKKKIIYFFCSTLVVGCTKTRFTLLYKRKIDLPVFCLTPTRPLKIAGNYLTKKLFNYLFILGFGSKNTIFSTKPSENGPKNGSNFAKIISRNNYLIICLFVRFSKQLVEEMESTSNRFFCSEKPPKSVPKDQKSK